MAAENPNTPEDQTPAMQNVGAGSGTLRSVRGGAVAGDHPAKDMSLRVLVGPATEKGLHNTVRPGLFPIACWRAEDMNFEFGSSFPMPDLAAGMTAFKEIFESHTLTDDQASQQAGTSGGAPGAAQDPPDIAAWARTPMVSLFGHADPVGNEEFNKTLSGQRARAIYALLIRDLDAWEKLHADGNWGNRSCQVMLEALGYSCSRTDGTIDDTTKGAIKRFQKRSGVAESGSLDAATRRRLHERYMDYLCADASGRAYKLDEKQFLGEGAAGGKASYQGCGEFNPVVIFSAREKEVYDRAQNQRERNNENAPNRRVVALLFRPGTRIDAASWPCPLASEKTAGCRKRLWSDSKDRLKNGDVRREFSKGDGTFGCRFYDRMSTGSPCERGVEDYTSVIAVRLVTVEEASCLGHEVIRIRGHGLDILAETDENGFYFRAPVPSGDYTISFQDVRVAIPSLPYGSEAHVLHAPHSLLTRRWGEGFFDAPRTIAEQEGAS